MPDDTAPRAVALGPALWEQGLISTAMGMRHSRVRVSTPVMCMYSRAC